MNKAQASRLHDALYYLADGLIKQHNPCNHDNIGCCTRDRAKGHKQGCCGGCRHLRTGGCSVKSLSCKVWLCDHLCSTTNDKLHGKLKQIHDMAFKYGLVIHRGSRAAVMRYGGWRE